MRSPASAVIPNGVRDLTVGVGSHRLVSVTQTACGRFLAFARKDRSENFMADPTGFALSPRPVELIRRGQKWPGEFPERKLASPRVNRVGDSGWILSYFPSAAVVRPGASHRSALCGEGKSET